MTNPNGSNSRLDRIEKLVEANALALEAARIQIRDGINETVAMLGQIAEDSARERTEIRRRQEESDQRFETMLADMRADREANHQEHQEFRIAIQALLNRQ